MKFFRDLGESPSPDGEESSASPGGEKEFSILSHFEIHAAGLEGTSGAGQLVIRRGARFDGGGFLGPAGSRGASALKINLIRNNVKPRPEQNMPFAFLGVGAMGWSGGSLEPVQIIEQETLTEAGLLALFHVGDSAAKRLAVGWEVEAGEPPVVQERLREACDISTTVTPFLLAWDPINGDRGDDAGGGLNGTGGIRGGIRVRKRGIRGGYDGGSGGHAYGRVTRYDGGSGGHESV